MRSKQYARKSMDYHIQFAHQAIQSAIHSGEIKKAIAAYHYDEERMKEGLALLEKAKKRYEERHIYEAEKLKAAEVLKKALKEARAPYTEYLQMARLILKNQPEAATSLGLKGKRKRALGGWLEDARVFYTNVLKSPVFLERFAEYGITKEKLQAGKDLLDRVEQAAAEQERKKGEALYSTRERNKALKELDQWVGVLLQVCRFAMTGKNEQYLEAVGIVVPSS